MDTGHRQADKELEKIAEQISTIFNTVNRKITKKMKRYLKKFEAEIKQHEQMVDDGEITEEEYEAWLTNRVMVGKEWSEVRDDITEDCHEGTQKAMAVAGASLLAVYTFNKTFAREQIVMQAKRYLGRNITVKQMASSAKATRPFKGILPKSPDPVKNRIWHRRKIESVIRSEMRKGKSVDKIAKKLHKVTDMNKVSAYRAVRTGVTSAENIARIDAMFEAEAMGMPMDKIWIATLDNRTRTSHRVMHGQRVPCTEYFSNGLFYPADPDGEPAEVYNCRCTLGGLPLDVAMELKDAPYGMGNLEWIATEPKSKPYPSWARSENE